MAKPIKKNELKSEEKAKTEEEGEEKEMQLGGEVQVFTHSEFGTIRVCMVDGEPWFVGKDVAEQLGYQNGSRDINRHVDSDDRQNYQNGTFDSRRGMTVINESGLYSLILSSKLPSAKKFKHWVTGEVLPSIRKHGAYMTPQLLQELLAKPESIIKILTALKEEQEKNHVLSQQNNLLTGRVKEMEPKEEYYDKLADSNGLSGFRETASLLGVREKELRRWLFSHHYMYRGKDGNLKAYADKKAAGYFATKEYVDTHGKVHFLTVFTQKGREHLLRNMIIKEQKELEKEAAAWSFQQLSLSSSSF